MPGKNKPIKVMVIFGTRPEAIKMAPVIKQLQLNRKEFKTYICVTAQHREMLDEVLRLFKIKAHYDLNIMKNNQSPFEVTSKGLLGIRGILELKKSDIILVQGDTTTAFAASLAAFYLKIPIGHIEAGLRTNDKHRPFPEEINRRLISHLADFHFAPTPAARRNLISEGVDKKSVFLTGNTVVDALFYILKKNKQSRVLRNKISYLDFKSKKIILVTAHRRENFGAPLRNICTALKEIIEQDQNIAVVYPVHPNPNVKKNVGKLLGNLNRVYLINPLNYSEFIYLMSKAYIVLTDSGGIQEEALSLGKPLLVMREKTERLEAVKAGGAMLVGTDIGKIVRNTKILLNNKKIYKRMAEVVSPFGDGRASGRIVDILKDKIIGR